MLRKICLMGLVSIVVVISAVSQVSDANKEYFDLVKSRALELWRAAKECDADRVQHALESLKEIEVKEQTVTSQRNSATDSSEPKKNGVNGSSKEMETAESKDSKKQSENKTRNTPLKDSYESLFAKAQEYEKQGKYVHALGTYWDAMEAEQTTKAKKALKAYDKLSDVIREGKPGWGKFDDEFDMYDGWKSIYKDFQSYWIEEGSRYVFRVAKLRKKELDMKTRTANYYTSMAAYRNKKYTELSSIIDEGKEKSKRSEWIEFSESSKSSSSSLFYTAENDYAVKLGIIDRNGKILVTGDYVNQKETSWLSDDSKISGEYVTKYDFIGVDRDTMKIIDGGDCSIVPVSVLCKEMEIPLGSVKFSMKDGYDTDVYAPGMPSLLKACEDCVKIGSFYMLKTEVTQGQYAGIMREHRSSFTGNNIPIDNINWYEAIVFCNRLSEIQGLTPCYTVNGSVDVSKFDFTDYKYEYRINVKWNKSANGWRLPTEKEWLAAADDGHIYSGSNDIGEVAWYGYTEDSKGKVSIGNGNGKPHNVATKRPNKFGLYDMSGNVSEWCWDNFNGEDSYRAVRGGSFNDGSDYCAISYRCGVYTDASDIHRAVGFRIVRNAK